MITKSPRATLKAFPSVPLRLTAILDLRAFLSVRSWNPSTAPRPKNLENFHLVTLDERHGTRTAVAVPDITLGEIKGFLLTFQNFRQAAWRAIDTDDSLISPLDLEQNEHL